MSESIGAMSEAVVVREVTDPSDPAIAGFGRMQRAAYFAPETLIPAEYVPQMLGGGGQTGSRRNFLLVAELDGQVVGGALLFLPARARRGVSTLMGGGRQLGRRGGAPPLPEGRLCARGGP